MKNLNNLLLFFLLIFIFQHIFHDINIFQQLELWITSHVRACVLKKYFIIIVNLVKQALIYLQNGNVTYIFIYKFLFFFFIFHNE